ncbi:helix-turn-helix domain-containing protein [Streptomyces pseudovenezuelae]|uniref:Transcriptional regulator with XRE-family HTH domain n=1 Tax=Streptomyces pseudovenezuelae TaxID=67350 RepID=A0ABT6M2L6_9ACTN|nr:helix-turn-helix transcriptional regulator [Streptomyces pseudovenezuelae]MDH6222797.1 transcriptional regulator with XRE-family HTH domain [Streptomyces pseudovenezuelae]
MHEEHTGRSAALTALRRRLTDALTRTGQNKTQLARRAGLGRTTVSEAFSPKGVVPSQHTVAALARALKLPAKELLELQRTAAQSPGTVTADKAGPGRPIGAWDPHALEVHPAGPAQEKPGSGSPAHRLTGSPAQRVLPGYVRGGPTASFAWRAWAPSSGAALGRERRAALSVGDERMRPTQQPWQGIIARPLLRDAIAGQR